VSPHNYGRTPPAVGWKDAEERRVSGPPIIGISAETVAFLDHLVAMQGVIDAARVILQDGIPSTQLVRAFAELDGTGGDAA
jgi:hypothetical protein